MLPQVRVVALDQQTRENIYACMLCGVAHLCGAPACPVCPKPSSKRTRYTMLPKLRLVALDKPPSEKI
jgi:hypothetical protein